MRAGKPALNKRLTYSIEYVFSLNPPQCGGGKQGHINLQTFGGFDPCIYCIMNPKLCQGVAGKQVKLLGNTNEEFEG